MRALLLLLSLCLCSTAVTAERADRRWAEQRAEQRSARVAFSAALARDQGERGRAIQREIATLIDQIGAAPIAGQVEDVAVLVAGLARLDGEAASALSQRLADLPDAIPADPAARKAWRQRFEPARTRLIKPLEQVGQRALAAGMPEVAHLYLRHVLAFHPEHPDLHRNLGLVRTGTRWYGPRGQRRVKEGLVWDDALGWVIAKDAARYAAGEYFDLQARRWTTLAAADTAHAAAADPWRFETEHLAITGTAKLRDLVAIANRLEAFYARIFAAYSQFFATGGQGVKLIFGLLDHEPLRVSIAADQAGYRASLPPGTNAGWSAGMWVPSAKSSFFSAGSDVVMYHEFTHQILDVFANGNAGAPTWLVEGVAVYTETPVFVDSELVLGRIEANPHIRQHLAAARTGSELGLDPLFALDSRTWSAAVDPGPQYAAAGAVVQFCMEGEDRRYRADFVDFLRDSYRGQTMDRKLWQYLGLERDAFVAAYRTWLGDAVRAKAPIAF